MKTIKNQLTDIITIFMLLSTVGVAFAQMDTIQGIEPIVEVPTSKKVKNEITYKPINTRSKTTYPDADETLIPSEYFYASIVFRKASHQDKCNAYLEAKVYGGTPPYVFCWNNCKTGAIINNACPGSYTVTITDATEKRIYASEYVGN